MHALRAPTRAARPHGSARALSRPATASTPSTTTTALVATLGSGARLVNDLLAAVAPLDRGSLATPSDRARVDALARDIEERMPATRAAASALGGTWRLVYISSPEVFRQSPFFDSFSAAVGDRGVAEAIFTFTDALPMARVGAATQTIDLEGESGGAGRLVSEVELAVGELPFFPGLRGVVESTAAIEGVVADGPSYRLDMRMMQTRVTNSLFTPLGGDAVVAPVEEALTRVRGPGTARVTYAITALADDNRLRVTHAEGTGLLMIHVRE